MVRRRDLRGVCGVLGVGLPRHLACMLEGAGQSAGLRVVAAGRAVPPLALRVQVLAVASVVGEQDALVLLRLVLGGTCATRVADLHELPVDLAHVELLGLAVVDRHEVVQLRRRLVQVAR